MNGARALDILIRTCDRPAALAVTLTSLLSQTFRDFRVVVSDQTEGFDPVEAPEVQAVLRVLAAHGHPIETHKHLPRLGMAEHRQFLLEQATAPYILFLDDDLILESDLLERMVRAIREEACGFVGCGLIGLSYAGDVRPDEQAIEFWEGPVVPEEVRPGTPEWERHRLHNAANLWHVQNRLGLHPSEQRKYKIAWVGGCVLYDTAHLLGAGGFGFWRELPESHCGEDVLAELRVMARHGACGILPSGAYHLELPTTLPDRRVNAPRVLAVHQPADEI
ncbi:MAG: glycosyltransferase family 2 protein [Candidatus Eisenbacteria bacterium]